MRKLLSILLLAVFGLPFASPAFAIGRSASDGVRACCRRAGAHHCAEMAMGDSMSAHPASGNRWSSQPDKCPFTPQATVAVHHQIAGAPASLIIFAALVSHPCGLAQTESKCRISQVRSRQKRGPPAVSLL